MAAPTRAKAINCVTIHLLGANTPTWTTVGRILHANLEAKSRPERTRLYSRDEIIGEGRRKSKSIIRDGLEAGQAPEARQEPARGQRHRFQPHLVPVQFLHFAAQIGDSVDQPKLP